LKKRTKKLLFVSHLSIRPRKLNEQKFFVSFFQKRNTFLLTCCESIMRVADALVNAAIFGAALLYLLLIALPLEYCVSRGGCQGPELDGFMPAFFFSIIGIPAVIAAIFKCLNWCFPHSTIVRWIKRGVWLLLAALVAAIVVALRLSNKPFPTHP